MPAAYNAKRERRKLGRIVDKYVDGVMADAVVLVFARLGRTILPIHAATIVDQLLPSKLQAKKTGPGPGYTPCPKTFEETGPFLAKWAPEALAYDESLRAAANTTCGDAVKQVENQLDNSNACKAEQANINGCYCYYCCSRSLAFNKL